MFDPDAYKERNIVERCINKFKQFRAVATRYDKREYIFHGTVDVTSIGHPGAEARRMHSAWECRRLH